MFLQNICIKWKISVILYCFDHSADWMRSPEWTEDVMDLELIRLRLGVQSGS